MILLYFCPYPSLRLGSYLFPRSYRYRFSSTLSQYEEYKQSTSLLRVLTQPRWSMHAVSTKFHPKPTFELCEISLKLQGKETLSCLLYQVTDLFKWRCGLTSFHNIVKRTDSFVSTLNNLTEM